jgi:hypothetical protein
MQGCGGCGDGEAAACPRCRRQVDGVIWIVFRWLFRLGRLSHDNDRVEFFGCWTVTGRQFFNFVWDCRMCWYAWARTAR